MARRRDILYGLLHTPIVNFLLSGYTLVPIPKPHRHYHPMSQEHIIVTIQPLTESYRSGHGVENTIQKRKETCETAEKETQTDTERVYLVIHGEIMTHYRSRL